MSKKRAMSLLLALALCLCLFPVSAFAAEDEFEIKEGVLTKYNGPGGNVTIPAGVTTIGDWAFSYCENLTGVTISNSVTEIGNGAFSDCTGLTSITIPNSVTTIGWQAFSGCTCLTSVTIPNSVTEIGSGAFRWCSLTSVTIPDSVTTIGDGAFQYCSGLTGVTIPNSVTEIGGGVFSGCTGLTGITVSGGDTNYTSVDGVLFSSNQKTLVAYPGGKQGSYTIPDGVTEIGMCAFQSCTGLTDVTIGNGVTEISYSAFGDCTGLTNVTIRNGVTKIGMRAFGGCTSLTSVTIPNSVTEIDWYAFSDCAGLTSVTIPNSVTEIGAYAFDGCTDLTDVYYGGSEAQWAAIEIEKEYHTNDPLLNAAIHYNSPMPQQPSVPAVVSTGLNPAASGTAYASTQSVKVDGSAKEFQYYALKDANGGVTNYVKLRDLADVLDGTAAQFNVTWSEETGVGVETKTTYATRTGQEGKTPFSGNRSYKKGDDTTLVNGAAVPLQAFVLTDDEGGGYTYYKLRDLGQALGFNVGYDEATDTVFIETDKPYDPSN